MADVADADAGPDAGETSIFADILASDQALRCFVLKYYGAMAFEIDGRVFVENMDTVFDWIRKGRVPRKRRSDLSVVKPDSISG